MKKTIIITGLTVAILAVAAYLLFAKSDTPKYEFRFDQVSNGDLNVNVTATGTINAVISVDVGTQVSGIISKLYADFNSVVKEGQVIAQIDPTFLQQSIKDAEANLEKVKAQLADSKRTLDRTSSLFQNQLESQQNLDAAQTTLETNQANMKQALASLDRAKINLSYATIYAPINGVVINRMVNVGQTVAASFSSPTLYTIVNDLRKMQVETTIDESDIGKVSIDQKATFTVDAYPEDNFAGVVSQIRLAPVSIQNVVNYTVIIDVDNNQLKLMPGMTANVNVLVAHDTNVVRVPNMALRFQPPAELIDSTKFSAHQGGRAKEKHVQAQNHTASPADSVKQGEMQPAVAPQAIATPNENKKYGIIQSFPEYQKSAYIPEHDSGMGKVWILNSKGKLEPVFLRTGLSDGKYTEITTTTLKPGDQIVIGASNNSGSTENGQNPLTGSSGGHRPGGGGFH
ncbi:MAG: efflux RND transporter periplasmic adaptor subunit [bacterium]|nr:efflux RND transporter periplasmic adaptor subunit [bacterium]